MVRSAERALDILEIVSANRNGLKHGEISKALGIAKSTLSKLLISLVKKDYLILDPSSKIYTIGPKVLFLANSYIFNLDIIKIAQPIIHEAVEKVDESVTLMIKSGEKGIIIYFENNATSVLIPKLPVGSIVPLYATAGGKTILAFLDTKEVDQYLSEIELVPFTPTTITKPDILRSELKKIRDQGLAYSDEEQHQDLYTIAAPIFDWNSRVVASIFVPFLKIRLNAERKKIIQNILRKSSAEISRRLGYNVNAK